MTAAVTMKTFANDVSPDRTPSIGTGNASASVAATSSNSAGPARVVTPSQKAKPTTTAAAAITGATTGHVPGGRRPARGDQASPFPRTDHSLGCYRHERRIVPKGGGRHR